MRHSYGILIFFIIIQRIKIRCYNIGRSYGTHSEPNMDVSTELINPRRAIGSTQYCRDGF